MSYTTIFFLAGDSTFSADFKNAFRGAMYVWNDVARRYLRLEGFPHFDEKEQMKVWNLGNWEPEKMDRHDHVVMLSTMDGALLEPSRWEGFVSAFELYAEKHPNSSIGEQAKAIREAMVSDKAKLITGIGWRQTSVCGDCVWMPWDEDSEEPTPYSPEQSSDHFWIMEEIDSLYPGSEVQS